MGAPQHNGKRGVIVGGPDCASRRFKVRVAGAVKALGLKPGNLWPLLFGPVEAQEQEQQEQEQQQQEQQPASALGVGEEGADADARATALLRAPPAACPAGQMLQGEVARQLAEAVVDGPDGEIQEAPDGAAAKLATGNAEHACCDAVLGGAEDGEASADPGIAEAAGTGVDWPATIRQLSDLLSERSALGPLDIDDAARVARFEAAFPEAAFVGWQLAEAVAGDPNGEIQEALDDAAAELATGNAEHACSVATLESADDVVEASADPVIVEAAGAAVDQPTAFDQAAAMMQLLTQDTELGPHFASQPDTLRGMENAVLHGFEGRSWSGNGGVLVETAARLAIFQAAQHALGLHDDVRGRAITAQTVRRPYDPAGSKSMDHAMAVSAAKPCASPQEGEGDRGAAGAGRALAAVLAASMRERPPARPAAPEAVAAMESGTVDESALGDRAFGNKPSRSPDSTSDPEPSRPGSGGQLADLYDCIYNEVSREACPRAGLTTGYRAAPRRGPAVPRLPGRFRYGRR